MIKGAYNFEMSPAARWIDTVFDFFRNGWKAAMEGPACDGNLCLEDPEGIDPQSARWLASMTGVKYVHILSGRRGDGELGLVRNNGRIDRLRVEGASIIICQQDDVCNPSAFATSSCNLLCPPRPVLEDLVARDAPEESPGPLRVHRSRSHPSLSDREVFELLEPLSDGMRNAVQTIDATEKPAKGWELSSLGIVEVGARYAHEDFYQNAARSLTVELVSRGSRVLKHWYGLQHEAIQNIGSAAEEIVDLTARIYAHPGEAMERAASDSYFTMRADLLLQYGYITRAQRAAIGDHRMSCR